MPKIVFCTLKVFSATGGIEKVCRVAGKAFYEWGLEGLAQTSILSMHDASADAAGNPYFPAEIFKGFAARKMQFMQAAVQQGARADILVLSHINLLAVGWLVKKASPKTRVILFAHGIEIWGSISKNKRRMLSCCDQFICVSRYTRAQVVTEHGIAAGKCGVVNNCIDPFLPLPMAMPKNKTLLERYGYRQDEIILFTLSRLSSKDRYKGYDKVFEALSVLKDQFPQLRYLVGGSYDAIEKAFVDQELNRLGLQQMVTIAGYLPDEDLSDHFALADCYVMPSKKEGFGIVFIEAMFYGLHVIAGNADGSTDALLDGQLGLLVDPDNVPDIAEAISKILTEKNKHRPDLELLKHHFSYESYKRQLEKVVLDATVINN